jgi:hypothetical protein
VGNAPVSSCGKMIRCIRQERVVCSVPKQSPRGFEVVPSHNSCLLSSFLNYLLPWSIIALFSRFCGTVVPCISSLATHGLQHAWSQHCDVNFEPGRAILRATARFCGQHNIVTHETRSPVRLLLLHRWCTPSSSYFCIRLAR